MLKAQHISMLEFCRTGRFGTLDAGASQDDMIEYLGEPTAWDGGQHKAFCHYGDVQIFFNERSLYLIHIDWFSGTNNTPVLNRPHQLEPWVLNANAQINEIIHALGQEKLEFKQEVQAESIVLKLVSGVKIGFNQKTQILDAITMLH